VPTSAVKYEHIPRNVAYGVPLPKETIEDEKEDFSRDEWNLFYAQMHDYYKDLTSIMLAAETRVSKLVVAQVQDVIPP